MDEEAAEWYAVSFPDDGGLRPYQISKLLSEAKVEIPAVHLARFQEGVNRTKPVKDPYGWGSSTIVNILKKREYLGHTINFKTRKHFKDKKSHYVDESEWTIFENTHEPSSTRKPLTMCSVSGKCQALPGRLGRGPSPDRPDVLCRLRRQDVCPSRQ